MKILSMLGMAAAIVTVAVGCGGLDDELDYAMEERAAVQRDIGLFAHPYMGQGGMRGVGTSRCSGTETSRWGDASRGGYQYVSCSMWYMSEWGPGYFTDEVGECVNGVIVSDASDSSWALTHCAPTHR